MDKPNPVAAFRRLPKPSQIGLLAGTAALAVVLWVVRSRKAKAAATAPVDTTPDPDTASIPGGRSGSYGSGGAAGGGGTGGAGTGDGGGGGGGGNSGGGALSSTSAPIAATPETTGYFSASRRTALAAPDQVVLPSGSFSARAVEGGEVLDADWFNGTNDPYAPNGTVTRKGNGGYFKTGTAGYSPGVIAAGGAVLVKIGNEVDYTAPDGTTRYIAQDANRLSLGGGGGSVNAALKLADYTGQTAPAFLLKIAGAATPEQLASPDFVASFNKQNAELGGTLRLRVAPVSASSPSAPPPPPPSTITPTYAVEAPIAAPGPADITPFIVPPAVVPDMPTYSAPTLGGDRALELAARDTPAPTPYVSPTTTAEQAARDARRIG